MPTLDQIGEALKRADAAGNTDDAKQLAQAYAQMRDSQAKPATQEAPAQPAEPSLMDQLRHAGAMGLRNTVQGLMSIPAAINDPIVYGINKGADALGLGPAWHGQTTGQALDTAMTAAGVPDAQPQNATERVVGRMEQGVGGLLGGMGAGSALSGTGNATAQGIGSALTSQPGAQLAATAAGTGLGGIAHEAGAGPKTEIAASLLGGLSPLAAEGTVAAGTSGLSRLLGSPDAQTSRLAGLAQDAGIPLKASQVSGSKVAKLVDSATGQVPFSGAHKFQTSQQQAFNNAVGKTIGVNEKAITPEVFARAKKMIGGQFDTLASRNTMNITPELVQKISALRGDVARSANVEAQTAIDNAFQRIVSQQQNSQLPGDAYKSLFSELGRMSSTAANPDKAHFAGQLRDMLGEAMDSSISPRDRQAWAQARAQYRDLKTIEPLMADASANGGNISPAKLMQRVTANKAGKSSVAQGTRGQLGDLAAVGQRFLKDTIPDSGTARRTAVNDMLKGVARGAAGTAVTGAAYLNPVATGLGAAAVTGISRQVQNILKSPRLVDTLLKNPRLDPTFRKALESSLNPSFQSLPATQGRR